jgi:hypothetical protein
MAGLVPAIHVFLRATPKGVDARNKCGHDSGEDRARRRPGLDDPCVSETRPRYAAYFFSEVLLLRGSSAGLT